MELPSSLPSTEPDVNATSEGPTDPRYRKALSRAGVTHDQIADLFAEDVATDLQPTGKDVTSWAWIDSRAVGQAVIRTRAAGRVAGIGFLPGGLSGFQHLSLECLVDDGESISPGQSVARLRGSMRELLVYERTALNLITHLSGIATLTQAYVRAVAGTRAKVCDTRKTLPGLRRLQKYAVRCGGGTAHRDSLGDAMLVKDNHLAGVPVSELSVALDRAAAEARAAFPQLKFVEVEVDTLEQLTEVFKASVDIVLLDNMPNEKLRDAVALRDSIAPQVLLEASGGVNLETVRGIAETGVDRVSVGALTHSAPALDLGLDIENER